MRGCVHRLQQSFYPDFDIRYVSRKKRKREEESGRERGKRVDREITATLHAPPENPGELHDFTRKWLCAVKHWGWTPVAAQLMIYDEAVQIATAIDCVYKNEKGELVFIEVKTGFEDYADKSTHFMRPPLGDVRNTPRNQHFLQLAVSCAILERHYWSSKYEAFVVRIDRGGIRREPLPEWAERHKDAVYEALLEHAREKRRHDRL